MTWRCQWFGCKWFIKPIMLRFPDEYRLMRRCLRCNSHQELQFTGKDGVWEDR